MGIEIEETSQISVEGSSIKVILKEEEYEIPVREIKGELRVYLPIFYKRRFVEIERELGVSTTEALERLIDFYYIEDPLTLMRVKERILKRLSKGVDRKFVVQLKLIYTALGHFLKRLRYL